MYDYLCDTLFEIPMKPVGPEVLVPEITDLEGVRRRGCWVEADFSTVAERPKPVFRANRYPYQLPVRPNSSLERGENLTPTMS